ncbi:MAG: response regulator [Alphaproteobacteria bacterium]|nr:response regulator [Alphaproteobacteria bacterium]
MADKNAISALVVDDNDDNLFLLGSALRNEGLEVTTASSGSEALALLAKSSFDIVFLDIMMPEVDGFDVLERIRSLYSFFDLPVIMVTALDDAPSVVRSFDLGANDYITKPFDHEVLVARAFHQLEVARSLRSPGARENKDLTGDIKRAPGGAPAA